MTPILWIILIPKFRSSTQLYGCHNLDILIAFPVIATETFLSGSPNFMDETSDKKKIKKSFFYLKAEQNMCMSQDGQAKNILANHRHKLIITLNFCAVFTKE